MKNSIIAIVGPSASGKTTKLKQLIPINEKSVVLNINSIKNDAPKVIKNKIISKINQNINTVLIDDLFVYLNNNDKLEVINFIKTKNKNIIYTTSDMEETLYANYIIIMKNNKAIIEGEKEAVLKQEKEILNCGLTLPFIVDLSIQLNYYELINRIYYDLESLVSDLWI